MQMASACYDYQTRDGSAGEGERETKWIYFSKQTDLSI
jgi:hypothetical protein